MTRSSIRITNLTKRFGDRLLLDSVSFSVHHGEKAGLVGLNGCGKSTLYSMIMGKEEKDEGNIRFIPDKSRTALLPQLINFEEETAGEVLEKALDKEKVVEEWEREVLKEEVLTNTGLENLPLSLSADKLSGGQRTRLYVAKLLISRPDFLLLDEPTNFLDLEGLQWIENLVRELPQGMIIVSHDRYFLDRVTDRIIEIEEGKVHEYSGNYSFYRKMKTERKEKELEEYFAQKKEIRRLKQLAQREKQYAEKASKGPKRTDRFRFDKSFYAARAKRHAKKAKAFEKRIDRMDELHKPRKNPLAKISFNGKNQSDVIARVESLSKSFGGQKLYSDVSFTLYKGEKVGILGNNGSGKTTLLKILQGIIKPDEGEVFLIDNDRIGYFSQIFEEFREERTILELVMDYTGLDKFETRKLLAQFLFRGERVFTPVRDLSIGERSRTALACIKGKEPELLILDEPTNHLDVDTTEIMEQALQDYEGSVIIVTHDRFLLDSLVDRLLVIEKDRIDRYPGGYTYYLQKKKSMKESAKREKEEDKKLLSSEKLLLEIRLAKLSRELGGSNVSDEEREKLALEFNELKEKLG